MPNGAARSNPAIGVLFVCTGNICRSPTAEAVLRYKVEAAGLGERVRVASCGTHDYHVGDPPDPRAQAHAARRGYDLSRLRASCLADEDPARYDLVVALDRGHERILRRRLGPEKVRLLMSWLDDAETEDVPDPYYGGPDDFERALDLIERACEGLLAELQRRLG
ncbi:MAG: low molecular weight phosphotyrosine protein phosphatase [Rhodospirillales bacterium]|nr:low molecular weight phosphotyrosine protein phosphatase [Rhodospirillales bacterium]